jgi:putative DNA primase/helicase
MRGVPQQKWLEILFFWRAQRWPLSKAHSRGGAAMDRPVFDSVEKLVAGLADDPEFTEDMLASKFAAEHQDSLRYVDKWGKWLQWNGSKWQLDDTRNVFTLSRAICRAAAEGAKKSVKAALGKAKTIAAVEMLARSDRRIAAEVYQWDGDPWLLNTPGAVIDLRTGQRRPNQPSDYITK